MNIDFWAQAVGTVGLICSLLSFQQKKRKNIMLLQMSASLLIALHQFMTGAVTGGWLDMVSFVRTLIFSNNKKKWASSGLWLYFFLAVMIGTGVLTWENGWSILAIMGACLSTIALWMKKERNIRLISLCCGPLWLVYCLVNGAYAGALNEVLAMTSIIIGFIRLDRPVNENKTENIEGE